MSFKITVEQVNTTNFYGCACRFVPIDENRGVKFYTDRNERDTVMARQKIGAMFGYAPQVYETYDLPDAGYYGFVVELVRTARNYLPEKYIQEKETWDGKTYYYANSLYEKDKRTLINKVSDKVGIYMGDSHTSNIGFTDDDRMIIIDWGDESVCES